jgi:uncharacterized protein Usg
MLCPTSWIYNYKTQNSIFIFQREVAPQHRKIKICFLQIWNEKVNDEWHTSIYISHQDMGIRQIP